MSSSAAGQKPSTPSSNFNSILDDALSEYKKETGSGLLEHPLAEQVKRCDSIGDISAILQGQAREFQQFRDGDQRLMKWISPMVDVLSTFSETLGGVASIAFPPAGAVFTGIGILLSAGKDVRASHDALVDLFERIESFFKRLGVYTQVSLTAEMAEVFVKIVAEVLSILSIATKEVQRKRAKIYFRKLLGRSDIEDAFKRLDNLINEEVRMVIAQILKATIEHKEDSAKANVAIVGSVGEVANNLDEIKWNQIEQVIRNWFSPPDPSTNHNAACEVYNNVPPTWFFRASVFEDWMSNGSLLWVHGKPGSGKSIFCSAIVQHVMRLRDDGNATLAYFYFDFRDEEKQNVRNVVTSLLVQLSAYSKPCCDIIYRLYLTHGKGMQQPSNGVLIDRLKEMLFVVAHHPIFVIMDALDESPDLGMPAPREAVLDLVKDLVYLHLQVSNLHICVTSRPEVDIQNNLKPLAVNTISLQDETRQKMVISDYVRSVVSSDEQMKQWRDEDKKLVVEELSERADGMFQWVFCQLETLRHAVQPDVLGILERLPNTLDETYERLLKNINESNRRHARCLLHCLAVSVRPLRVEELAEILTFDFDADGESIPMYRPDRRPNNQEAVILSICPNLITIVDNRGSRVVQFSHLSVKEFLTSDHLSSTRGDLSMYHILPARAHTILAQICLGFLLHPNNYNNDESANGSPLAEYAAQHWVTHAQFEDVATRVTDGIESLLDADKHHFSAWVCLFDPDGESSGRLPSEIPSPLYYFVLCGFHNLVRHIAIKHPEFVNAIGGSYGFPLDAALCRNNFPVAEILLKHGGKVDVRDAREQTALHKTIDRHDKVATEVVQFLLDNGADVNAQRDDLRTPLHLALNVGELNVAQLLLERQADVNARNDDGQTPLHLLTRGEVPLDKEDGFDLVKLLLKRGANVNEGDKDKATPLHLASYYKRLEIVRLLLDHGADTTMENARSETPIQTVLKGNSNSHGDGVDVARLLVEHRAKAYSQATSGLGRCFEKEIGQAIPGDGDDYKAESSSGPTFQQWLVECGVDGNVHDKYDTILLHSALYQGSPEMVARLLDYCVRVDAKNHWGETALHVISRRRHDSQGGVHAAQVLLDRGADANSQGKNNWTPLHFASYFGNVEIVRLLLDHGADPEAAESDIGEKPLHKVSGGKYQSQEDGVRVVQLLLEHGADVNTRRKDDWTPLHLASYFGNVEVARLLLDHGADPEAAEGDIGEKPLHKVSYRKYRSQGDGFRVARLLLDRGADVNTRRTDNQTPLHVASHFGNVEIVRLLLDHGADLEAAGGDIGEKSLHQVSVGEYKSQEDGVRVAELLLDSGADVNTRRTDNQTPLHVASYLGNVKIVRLLLDHGADLEAAWGELGGKPLHLVSCRGYRSQEDGVRVAQLLLDRGADVNTRRMDHQTPLHVASSFGNVEIVRLLLDHGADLEAAWGDLGGKPLHRVSCREYRSQEDGVRVAQLLLDRGAYVNTRRKDHQTPLHVASSFGNVEIVRLLLDHGADLEAAWGELGGKPLHQVSFREYRSQEDGVRVAQLLLDHGADVDTRRKDHQTPLHVASSFGNVEIVRLLLDNGADIGAAWGDLGGKPLHRVSCREYKSPEDGVRVAQLLLDRGADVNTRRTDNQTPLHVASYLGNVEIVRLLLGHGADLEAAWGDLGGKPLHQVSCGDYRSQEDGVRVAQLLLDHGADVDTRRKDHQTPLHVASSFGNVEIARLLLDHGADLEAAWGELGGKPLHRVSCREYKSPEDGVRVAQLLLDHSADVNTRRTDDQTPLHVASSFGNVEIVRLLLDHGADLEAAWGELGGKPLHRVSCREYRSQEDGVRVAQLLLDCGADVDTRRKDHQTPLHVASYFGNVEIVRLLLDNGADLEAVAAGDSGEKPLHQVSYGKYRSQEDGLRVAQLLLDRGADINARRDDHRTPLHLASYRGNADIVQLFVDHGAEADAKDNLGKSPLHEVSKGKYESQEDGFRVAQLLLDHGADVNAKAKSGRTPLKLASINGMPKLAELFLEHAANVNTPGQSAKSKSGRSLIK